MDAMEAIAAMENYISRKIAARDGANQCVLTMPTSAASAVNGAGGKLDDKRLTPYSGSMLSTKKHTAGWLQSAGDDEEQHPETVSSDPLSEWQELVECLDPREQNDNACSMAMDEPKEDEPEEEECPVCLDALSEAKTLNCPNGHTFCRDCLRRVYMQTSPRVLACPLCRTTIDSSALKLRAFRAPKGGAIVTLRIGNTHAVPRSGQTPHRTHSPPTSLLTALTPHPPHSSPHSLPTSLLTPHSSLLTPHSSLLKPAHLLTSHCHLCSTSTGPTRVSTHISGCVSSTWST